MNSTNSSTDWQSMPTGRIIVQILSVLFFILIFGGNALVIIAFAKYRTLQTVTNAFLLNLAVADLLYGTLNMPIWFLYNSPYSVNFFIDKFVCFVTGAMFITLMLTSLFTLLAVTMERYFAIIHPFTHMKYFEKRKIAILSSIIWLITISYGTLSLGFLKPSFTTQLSCLLVVNEFYMLSLLIIVSLCLITTTVVYIKIGCVARAHSRSIAAQSRPGNQDTTQSDRKLMKMLSLILISVYVSWGASAAYLGIYVFRSSSTSIEISGAVIGTLISSGAFINPLIYAGMDGGFRTAFKKIIRCEK